MFSRDRPVFFEQSVKAPSGLTTQTTGPTLAAPSTLPFTRSTKSSRFSSLRQSLFSPRSALLSLSPLPPFAEGFPFPRLTPAGLFVSFSRPFVGLLGAGFGFGFGLETLFIPALFSLPSGRRALGGEGGVGVGGAGVTFRDSKVLVMLVLLLLLIARGVTEVLVGVGADGGVGEGLVPSWRAASCTSDMCTFRPESELVLKGPMKGMIYYYYYYYYYYSKKY